MPVTPTYTYNIEEALGKTRLLIGDVGGQTGSDWVFSDQEIEAFLLMRQYSFVLAAATALRAIAANGIQVQKVIKFLELETSGDKFSKALIELANEYEKQSDEEVEIELVEMGVDTFSQRQLRAQAAEMWEFD